MKYFLVTLENYDKDDLWIENQNIPFRKKKFIPKKKSYLYFDCFFNKDNIELIDYLPKNIEIFEMNETPKKTDVYYIYSDGGSFNNGRKDPNKPVFGSMTTIICKNNKEIFKTYDALEDVTNNYCEVTAGLNGLLYVQENEDMDNSLIIMSSDSQYLMKGINEWMTGWIQRGWKNNEGKPISNSKQWKTMYKILMKHDNILTCWVRGHQDNDEDESRIIKYNNECDYLCNVALNNILLEHGLPTRKLKGR
jgi:ribonuclease HI